MLPHIFGVLQGESVKWHWSEDELETQWSLTVAELALLPGRTDSGRLGFAILLKFFQFQGFFPDNQKSILTKLWPTLRRQRTRHWQTWMFMTGADAPDSDTANKF